MNEIILTIKNKDDDGLVELIYDCLKINLLCDNNKLIISECIHGISIVYGNS